MSHLTDRERALALVEELIGPSDERADRAVAVLNAQAAALDWARQVAGTYPAPRAVSAELARVAAKLRSGEDDRDPVAVLGRCAVDAMAALRASAAL